MIQYDRMEIALAIGFCEAAFWLLLFGGMAARYGWRRRRLSTVLLALIPVADALLLAFTAVYLARGAEAAPFAGLARASRPRLRASSSARSWWRRPIAVRRNGSA